MIKIISDSTCDLSQEVLEKYDIDIIPLHIVKGNEELEDGPAIDISALYKWADENKTTPKTSAPSIETAMNIMRPYIEAGREIICFSISGEMSTSGNVIRMAAEELEAAITLKTKILVMPFPNNPTGSIMTKEDLEPIAEVVKRHDLYVLSDEIYSELTYKTEHVSISSLPGMKERTLVINGFSKGFAMTGWRLGYICGPSVIIEQMLKIHQYAIMCAPTNSQYAAIEGLRHCEDEVQQMRNAYNQRRRYLVNEFAKMKLECFEPFGAFYIFPSIKEFGMTSEEFAMRFLEEEKVAVVPGSAFGESGEGFLRVSYAYSLEDLKEAIGRLSRFVERLRSQK